MKASILSRAVVLSSLVFVTSNGFAGVNKTLRVDNTLDASVTVYLEGKALGTVDAGEVKTFAVKADAATVTHLLAVEGDGATYTYNLSESHPNGFTWGLYEGDGVEAKQ